MSSLECLFNFSLPGSNANGRNLRVVLGGPNLLTSFLQANTGDVFNVTQIIPLPGFVQRTSLGYPVNDMALLKFARNNVVLDTSRICAICLPPRPLSHDDCRRVFVSGYGSIREGALVYDYEYMFAIYVKDSGIGPNIYTYCNNYYVALCSFEN